MKETRAIFGQHHDRHDLFARHAVMTPDMIRQLPARYALIVRGGMSPVSARLPMAWTDPVYQRARRTGQTAAVLTSAAEPGALIEDVSGRRNQWPDRYTEPDALPPSTSWDDPGRYPWQ